VGLGAKEMGKEFGRGGFACGSIGVHRRVFCA